MRKAISGPLLLDVNVLLALAWPNHQFHLAARAALAGQIWATCAITELAFVRLSLVAAVVGQPQSVQTALGVLASMVADPRHRYWADLPDVGAACRQRAFERVMGHRQVSDAYLLELARRKGGRLLTFDRRLEALGAEGVADVLAP